MGRIDLILKSMQNYVKNTEMILEDKNKEIAKLKKENEELRNIKK